MDENIAVEVKNVTKQFKVFHDKGYNLKEKVLFKERNYYELKNVLNNINFSVKKGESLGIIGKNGCGKSTLLKLLTKIMYPDSGSIEIKGRVACLIELGAGFHPDMTGRENIYINASIFGLNKKEIDNRINKIIDFAELGDYIDSPVRTYSSGMYMRLAFSIAINVDADVLLVDEILAVGDANFQEKCFAHLKKMKELGVTIVLVTHDMNVVKNFCDRALFINDGVIVSEGNPISVVEDYLNNKQKCEIVQKEIVANQVKSEKKENKHWISSFQGLRFIFIVMLFLHHLDAFNELNIPGWNNIFKWLYEGFFSVNFFFILSGFVVSMGYKNKILNKEISSFNFLFNRFMHLWPTHVFTLLLASFVYAGSILFKNPQFWVNLFMLHGFIPDGTMGYAFSFNGASWTLSVEMFFYILFPLVCYLSPKERKWLCIGWLGYIILFITLISKNYVQITSGWITYINPIFRFAEFLLGMNIYDLYLKTKEKLKTKTCATILEFLSLFLLIISVCIAVHYNNVLYIWKQQLFYIIPISVIIFVFSFNKGIISAVLSTKIFNFLGKIAFPFYLLHQIIINICKRTMISGIKTVNDILLVGFISFIVTLISSILLHFIFIVPCSKIVNKIKKKLS